MAAFPEPVAGAIVRGMSAYMQQANRSDLPASLRPLQGKHLKMLTARKDAVLSALDDEGVRAMVLEWLEDRPAGITKPDARVLAIAARRDEGWADDLAGSVPQPKKAATPQDDPGASLDREKVKSRKARDETRRIKEESAREVAGERRKAETLQAVVDELTARMQAIEKRLGNAEKERDAARAELEREVRKARRRAEKAEALADSAKATTRTLRADLARRESSAEHKTSTKKQTAAKPTVAEPARRRRLPVPKGRLSEDPATLTEWLSTPHVHLLVDGYNVSKAEGGFGDLRLEAQRSLLLQEVGKVARRNKVAATVVFDGSEIAPGTSRRARGPVEVEYSRPEEIADDHLIAKLEGLPKHPCVVVTNDKELQHRAARLGATIATSGQLLGLIR